MSTTSTPGPAPKSMSSRLLTMKFMQRAAASSPTSASPTSPDEPSPKRRKTDANSTPSKFNVDALADQRAIQAAMASEEAKREAALERAAAEAGDTRWVLSFEDQKQVQAAPALALRVVQTGFAHLDSATSRIQYMDEEEEDKPAMVGRRSFGKFNRVLEKQQDPSAEDTSDSDSDEDEDDDSAEESGSDDNDPTSNLIKASRKEAAEKLKAQRKAKKKADKAASVKMAKERKKKEITLNGLTSLSGRQDNSRPPIKCFKCGGPHAQADCPQKRRYQGGDDGPPRKSRRSK